MESLLANPGDELPTLVLFDDVVGTGKQSLDIIRQWLGLNRELELNEDHVRPLRLAERVAFRLLRSHLIVLTALQPPDQLAVNYRKLLPRFESVQMASTQPPAGYFEPAIYQSGGETAREAEEFLGAVGEQLMRPRWQEQAKDHTLGYHNQKSLLVFSHNVPTSTVSALWAKGEVAGHLWLPMFQRRSGKPKDPRLATEQPGNVRSAGEMLRTEARRLCGLVALVTGESHSATESALINLIDDTLSSPNSEPLALDHSTILMHAVDALVATATIGRQP